MSNRYLTGPNACLPLSTTKVQFGLNSGQFSLAMEHTVGEHHYGHQEKTSDP